LANYLLEWRNVNAGYEGMQVLKDISLHVKPGEVVTVLGRNGAGKTTLLRTLLQQAQVYSGDILYEGQSLQGTSIINTVKSGITYVPQEGKVFPQCTVKENLLYGLAKKNSRKERNEKLEQIITQFPKLKERLHQQAGLMSGGEQQALSVARALMSDPKVLLLDEPSLGLSPKILGEIFKIIESLKENGLTIVLTEQNVTRALGVADRVYVLDLGTVIRSSSAETMRNDPEIKNIYFSTANH
jgi:branched-chain amino acid transport system ATP-binding protein